MSYIVRRSTINDLPDVYSFELAYIKEIEPTAEQRWRNATHALLRQWISNLPRMFIAIHGMESIGHCFWQIEGTDALLASIYVVPSWRKQGYGLLLLHSYEQDAIEQGFTRLTLGVHETNSARALYTHAGYSKTHKDNGYEYYEKIIVGKGRK